MSKVDLLYFESRSVGRLLTTVVVTGDKSNPETTVVNFSVWKDAKMDLAGTSAGTSADNCQIDLTWNTFSGDTRWQLQRLDKQDNLVHLINREWKIDHLGEITESHSICLRGQEGGEWLRRNNVILYETPVKI